MNRVDRKENLPIPGRLNSLKVSLSGQSFTCIEKRYKHPFFSCASPYCPWHQHRWQVALEERLLKAASADALDWFIVLPIGELVSNEQWISTWASFRDKMRHRYKPFEYFRILKLGKENLHVHVIAKTYDVIDKDDLRKCWKASLQRHAGIDLGNRRVYCQMLYSWEGTAAYLPRIESQLQGECLPPRGQFHRVIQSSWKFWEI